MMHSTLPKTPQEKAALQRSRQLTEFRWTPVRDVPTFTNADGQIVLEAGVEVKGFPYASTELNDKFFTENISFETFLSAIANPHSKLYQPGHAALQACNYGIVCNGLVRYALGIERRVSTKRWYTIPGMRMVAKSGEYLAEDIKLLDIIYAFCDSEKHVALITDILRDDSGNIIEIEVSEAVRPYCKCRRFSVDDYFKRYKRYDLCRYDKFDEVPLLNLKDDDILWNSGIEKVAPKISVDNGNKSNYLVGDEVVLSIFGEEKDTVLIHKNGELITEYLVTGKAVFPLVLERGYYVATLKNANESVEFCVNEAEISYEVNDGVITINANPHDTHSKIVYMDFREKSVRHPKCASLSKYEELSESEKESQTFSRPIPEDAENFKVYFKNEYGVWTNKMTKI